MQAKINCAELGVLDGPLLLFGGPYSNDQATEALLAEAQARDIPPQRIICTGDVVAYGGDPGKTVDLIRGAGVHVVMGNCEEAVGFGADDCGCGFEEKSECAVWSRAWYAHAVDALRFIITEVTTWRVWKSPHVAASIAAATVTSRFGTMSSWNSNGSRTKH